MDLSPGLCGRNALFLVLSLLQQQLDIPIPKYFLKEKLEVVKGREKILSQILADTGFSLSDKVRTSL